MDPATLTDRELITMMIEVKGRRVQAREALQAVRAEVAVHKEAVDAADLEIAALEAECDARWASLGPVAVIRAISGD